MIGLPETKNNLTNAIIVGAAKSSGYTQQTAHRGDPAFAMSRSELKNFAVCPSRWLAGYKEGGSEAQSYGDQLDCLVLTPGDFSRHFVVAPSTYPGPKSAKKGAAIIQKEWNWNATHCKEWRQTQGEGVTVIKHDESVALLEAKASLLRDADIREMLQCSEFQILITAEYRDKESSFVVPIKGLVDIAPSATHPKFGQCLADLKTCSSAHPMPWAKEVAKYGYDMQAALYLDIWTAATGEDRLEFRHVLQENFPPYQIGKRLLSSEFLNVGRMKYQAALKLYCRCLTTDTWPNYETGRDCLDGWSVTDPEPWMLGLNYADPACVAAKPAADSPEENNDDITT